MSAPSLENPFSQRASSMDTSKRARFDNTALAPNVNQTMSLPTAKPRTAPGGIPPFNARQVYPYDSSSDSAVVDVFTGIMDTGRLTDVRDRAVYDLNTLTWDPVADSGTGVLFPDAVLAKTNVESALRVRPSTFKGPKQLDISYDSQDVHFDRQIHPNGWVSSDMPWYKNKGELPFVGYPNPNYFATYTDVIPTHNVQNLSHSQLVDAMRATSSGDFDHDAYLKTVGALLRSDAVPRGPAAANIDTVIQTDGGGVNSDPRIMERIAEEYEVDFNLAKRIRVADATNDPRFVESAPGTQYNNEVQSFKEAQETQFSKVQQYAGIPTGYTQPEVFHT